MYDYGDCSDETSYYWSYDEYGCRWALFGGISWSLLSLQHLRHLDLSGNSFQGNPIPEFLGSFTRLTYLNLSGSGFEGKIPDQLGNLSNLHHLDLSYNLYEDDTYVSIRGLYIESAGWISRLASLRHLNMDFVSFTNASNWLQAMNTLPHLQELRLAACEIVSFPPHNSLLHVNFTSLTILDLSSNDLNSSVPSWLFHITGLEHLDLGWNDLNWPDLVSISKLTSLRVLDLSYNVLQHGFVLTAFCNLCNLGTLILHDVDINDEIMNLQVVFSGCLMLSLEELDLSSTRLRGYLPDWLWSMKNLKDLSLYNNTLYGPVPASLGSLSSLQYLDLSDNHLNGTVPEGILGHMRELIGFYLSDNSLSLSEVHLANLSATLKSLDISSNTLVLNESYKDWIPSFQLEYLNIDSCIILPKPQFPKWLQTTTKYLYIGGNSLSLSEVHLANLPATLKNLDISSNTLVLNESYEDWIPSFQLEYLNMDSCIILPRPQFPKWLQTQRALFTLYLPSMGIKDMFPTWLPNTINYLYLTNNSFSGQLPSAINNMMPRMIELDLSANNLSGSIPLSICQIKHLFILRLSENNFSGEVPNCWKNSTKIIILDLSSNKFQGVIPNSLCGMQRLQSLHLSNNNLSGQIPTCLRDCTRLIRLDLGYNHLVGSIPTWIEENLLHLYVLILRSNDFTGNISSGLSNLEYLQVLDLSNNKLSGTIPLSFGNFSALRGYPLYYDYSDIVTYSDAIWLFVKGTERKYVRLSSYDRILDLSNNDLHGYIPKEMENLNLLQSLNLSYNFLIGEIPRNIDGMQQLEVLDLSKNNLSGTQLQTFDQYSYLNNLNLCGSPLPNNCLENTTKYDEEAQKKDTSYKNEIIWFFASVALGFITGFWMVCGVLLSQRKWRFAFVRAVDDMYEKLYVMIAMYVLITSK